MRLPCILDSNSKNSFFFETPEKTSWYYQTRALSHFNRGRYSVSALWYDSCLQITPAYVSSRTWARAALAHIELGNIESATKLLDLARARATDSEDTLYYNLTKARLAAIKDDFKYAYKLQDSIYCNYNVVRNKLLSHPYATVLTDYFKTLSDDRQQTVLASRHKIYFLSIIVILLIILLVTAFILYRRRRQLDDIMKDSLISDIQKLKQDLESLSVQDREKSVSPATTPVLSDYDSSCNDNIFVKLLDELFSKEHISPSSANVNARHHRSFQTILAKLKSESSLREIEALANLYNGNLIERLRKEVPRMTQFQLNYFSLMMLGFSNSSICYVLDVTNVKAIHQLRSRIKTRIEESESDDKKLFLSSLKK